MLKKIPGMDFDPLIIVFADSLHGDQEQGMSTACDLQVSQGGLVDYI